MTVKLPNDNYLNKLLMELEEKKIVSDIHLKSGFKAYCRKVGDIIEVENSEIFTSNSILEYLQSILNDNIKLQYKTNLQADFGFSTSNDTRYRANLYRTSSGLSLALRRINNKISTFDELMAPEIMTKLADLKNGLIIISGPTGSGKSTTLSSFMDYINSNYKKHIITIEDPIEFVYKNKNSLIEQREVGNDVKSFDLAITASLREDPDIILIGEIRDSTTIKKALTAAETGHLVFTTLHTQTAAKAIDRIVDSCEASEKELVRTLLATSLQAVILQRLLKRKDGNGMVAAYEVLVGTSAVRNLVKENKISQINSLIQSGSRYGMIDMKTSIEDLYKKDIISKEEMDYNLTDLNEANSN